MSAPLINRSLTTIRTELEFLHDSEVIDEKLYQRLLLALPHKYIKDMPPWGVDKLDLSDGTEEVTEKFSRASMAPAYEEKVPVYAAPVETPMAPPSVPPANPAHKPIGYCKALFDYSSNEAGDLNMSKDDKIAVVEHMSEDWWKGYKQGSEKPGVFPSNYVNVISEQEFESTYIDRKAQEIPEPNHASGYASPPQPSSSQQGYQPQQQGYQPNYQPNYDGYAQYPPPSANYYQTPPQQQVQPVQPAQPAQEQPQKDSHLKKFGSKFGNAAIFGAGATLGGDIINSIF